MNDTAEALSAKEQRLRSVMRSFGSCLVAYSGGVDSALILKIASDELGENAIAITASSPSLSGRELKGAITFATSINATVDLIETAELDDPRYVANSTKRCYFCKRELYSKLTGIARTRGIRWIADGTNMDDLTDVRPGRVAAKEFSIRSPLLEAELSKRDVRDLAHKLGLNVWDKPAMACLSSRFPEGTEISVDLLRQVEEAEDVLYQLGFSSCRVRHHSDIARIEVPPDEIARFMEPDVRKAAISGIRKAGYRFACVDLDGYTRKL